MTIFSGHGIIQTVKGKEIKKMKERNMEILKEMVAEGYICNNMEWKAENFSTEEILRWKEKFKEYKKRMGK